MLNDFHFKEGGFSMKWHLKVPKILHVYWGTGSLPYLRYLTVQTFLMHNPDWQVIVWQPKYPAKVVTWDTKELDYAQDWVDTRPQLFDLPIKQEFVDFEKFGLSNEMSEVHKSDYLRYWVLHNYGGVWSDMDILYLCQIAYLLVNKAGNSEKETFVCISPAYGHSIGFLMAAKGSIYFKQLLDVVECNPTKYQSLGADACNANFPTLNHINAISPAVNIGMEAVYAYDARYIRLIYGSTINKFKLGSIGLHWFAGHQMAGKFLKDTSGGVINIPKNVIGNVIRRLV